jgi:glycogen(starch) synthase
MRVVMLGWEFPPFISGGLGTACHGLTRALDRKGHQVLFILPRPVDRSQASHVRLLSPEGRPGGGGGAGAIDAGARAAQRLAAQIDGSGVEVTGVDALPAEAGAHDGGAPAQAGTGTRVVGVPARMLSPYPGGGAAGSSAVRGQTVIGTNPDGTPIFAEDAHPELLEQALFHDDAHPHAGHAPAHSEGFGKTGAGAMYKGDLFHEAERYARLVVALAGKEQFDVIHAHDWLTYPAGIALARVTGRPLVVHVHSTEFDRSGEHVNQRVYDVERRGMMSAMRVLAVSELTRGLCTRRYGVPESKVDVVYNGIDDARLQPGPKDGIAAKDKIVLFLGRITMQKGPEYFIAAAKRVLEKEPSAKFIMAGAGDMEVRMIELAAQLGIGHRVLFTGFLRGGDVAKVYEMADVYVMPSVSEPFGIAPLEAIRSGAPVIISKQSGVSEVLTHALKVDFWDVDEMANKIVAVLRHPPLGQTLRDHGSFELRRLTWETAADACVGSYQKAISELGALVG